MKQYFRRPQDVVGEDRDLLTYWNTMSGKVHQDRIQELIRIVFLFIY